jgi:hypothetical protein
MYGSGSTTLLGTLAARFFLNHPYFFLGDRRPSENPVHRPHQESQEGLNHAVGDGYNPPFYVPLVSLVTLPVLSANLMLPS